MTASGGIALLTLLLALLSIWVGILWVRPAVARARVQREALLVQDRIWNAMHDGEIDRSSARAQDALLFCQFLIDHPKELCLTNAVAVGTAWKRAGSWDDQREAMRKELAELRSETAEGQTSVGNRILQEAEAEIDRIVKWYFFRGSAVWPLLTPLSWFTRACITRAHSLDRLIDTETTIAQALDPDSVDLATEVRETSALRHHGSDWLDFGQGLNEARWGLYTGDPSLN